MAVAEMAGLTQMEWVSSLPSDAFQAGSRPVFETGTRTEHLQEYNTETLQDIKYILQLLLL